MIWGYPYFWKHPYGNQGLYPDCIIKHSSILSSKTIYHRFETFWFQAPGLPLRVHFPHRTPTSSNFTKKNANLQSPRYPAAQRPRCHQRFLSRKVSPSKLAFKKLQLDSLVTQSFKLQTPGTIPFEVRSTVRLPCLEFKAKAWPRYGDVAKRCHITFIGFAAKGRYGS